MEPNGNQIENEELWSVDDGDIHPLLVQNNADFFCGKCKKPANVLWEFVDLSFDYPGFGGGWHEDKGYVATSDCCKTDGVYLDPECTVIWEGTPPDE
jgi:hypothetical protein